MKIYLDDIREAPDGWKRAYWPDEVTFALGTQNVTHISLDHDLGDDTRGTGYDVILWIEEAIVLREFNPPEILIHTANPAARTRMEAGVLQIKKLIRAKNNNPS